MFVTRALACLLLASVPPLVWGCSSTSADLEDAGPDDGAPDLPVDGGPDVTPEPDVAPEPDAAEPDVAEPDVAEPDVAPEPDVTPEPDTEPDVTPEPDAEPDVTPDPDPDPTGIGAQCFGDIFDPEARGPDYDQFTPTVGEHCQGTQHQHIEGIQRVVFLGDSVTVGTPPTPSEDFYRARLAEQLATRFGLAAPSVFWRAADPLNGTSGVMHSGDFWSCAKWGARTDDLMKDSSQVLDCFPEEERQKKRLVIMTMGGNDIASITKAGPEGVPLDDIWAQTETFVQDLHDAVSWMVDPGNIPGGVQILFANMFEFTDGTGDVGSCASASLAGFDEPWDNPQDLEDLVIWANEQYMNIAVQTGTDMVFMLEQFCGHGYHHDDPANRCYRGPDAERWFDLTCIHPNPTGHEVIADMFMAVVDG